MLGKFSFFQTIVLVLCKAIQGYRHFCKFPPRAAQIDPLFVLFVLQALTPINLIVQSKQNLL